MQLIPSLPQQRKKERKKPIEQQRALCAAVKQKSRSMVAEPKSTTTPEVLLSKYKLGSLLGRGSFAKVYFAQSLQDGAGVAIKVIDKSTFASAGMEPRILSEVEAMRRLRHPNIVRIHEVMATKTKIYLVMEYARGGDLFSKIAHRGRLAEPLARKYFQQLVWSIHFCHLNGVVHRDIKPQNLLLDLDGNLKVSDFGLSALEEPGLLLQTACGTPAFTAPEVIERKGYAGVKADAWSCGVILFVFLAGYIPFDDSNLVVLYRKIQRREYEFPPWFSRAVKRLISRLLDPNPKTRMSIEGLMEFAWMKKDSQGEVSLGEISLHDLGIMQPKDKSPFMNAFDIISMSSGLDLSPLFNEGKKKENRFTSTSPPEKILERVEETGSKWGYRLQKKTRALIGLVKGRVVIIVEVLELAEALFLVIVKLSDDRVESEGTSWEDMKAGFGDIVLAWHNDTVS